MFRFVVTVMCLLSLGSTAQASFIWASEDKPVDSAVPLDDKGGPAGIFFDEKGNPIYAKTYQPGTSAARELLDRIREAFGGE